MTQRRRRAGRAAAGLLPAAPGLTRWLGQEQAGGFGGGQTHSVHSDWQRLDAGVHM